MSGEVARKICMVGAFGVGKTSLVARFVHSTFSDKYLTTVGVKVDTRVVPVHGDRGVKLVVWDIAGRDALDGLSLTYLRGASALLLVADGTREATLDSALGLLMESRMLLPEAVAVLAVNKLDRVDGWEVLPQTLVELRKTLPVFETSALSGEGVEQAFTAIATRLVS